MATIMVAMPTNHWEEAAICTLGTIQPSKVRSPAATSTAADDFRLVIVQVEGDSTG